jgi:hypothetical protein
MQRRTVLATMMMSIISLGIGSSSLAYGHVDACSGSNNGKPFLELWTAVCDLQSQVDSLQKQVSDLQHVPLVAKQVHLAAATCTNDPSINPTPFGWCPDGTNYKFLISDPAVTTTSVIFTNTVAPQTNSMAAVRCTIDTVNFVEGPDSGFLVVCDASPAPGTGLNYVVFNTS